MNQMSQKISNFRTDILQNTQLGRICASGKLFCDRYEIISILGRGGFGVTFLAKNVRLPGHPLCVIKQLCPQMNNPQKLARARKRFAKEAKILGQVGSHSQIPMLLDYFEINGEFYLVQEYISGLNLSQVVKKTGVKNEVSVKQFLRQILPVLQYIHNNHVIHRDIKPHNLLHCQDDGRLVLIDFGAVKEEIAQVNDIYENKQQQTSFVGTMGFAAPEQLSLHPVYASDIYAVGVTCLYLLTGKPPLEFDYDSVTGELCWQQYIDLTPHFTYILNKMLKICVEERFQSAQEVLVALSMESELPTLTDCLSSQRLSMVHTTHSQDDNIQQYLPPVSRTAQAIRQWRTKLKTKIC
ncbi:serine/threonine-protein kinase [Calothrix rhizosoleniae]|uniref:serine/threonine-protein kinase n=1 Tax=Calothrix rhizosoleniae TaxID=888997 RepID=UPI000B4A0AE6|nr:serine/threonine-protein kinase [Calothrix rhizosoleniae]